MGLGTDAEAVAEAVGRHWTRPPLHSVTRDKPWSVVSCPLFVDGRRGNGPSVDGSAYRRDLDAALGGIPPPRAGFNPTLSRREI